MNVWQRWVRRPRTPLLRKVCFQVHLWIGIAIGFYIVLLSVTGSALVFRREMDAASRPQAPPIDASMQLLTKGQLTQAALEAYPGATVERVGGPQRRTALVRVVLQKNGETFERDFNALTGEDLGEPWPWKAQAILKLAELHDDLLMPEDRRGRFWNGVGSILVTVLCVTGAFIWWPGVERLAARYVGEVGRVVAATQLRPAQRDGILVFLDRVHLGAVRHLSVVSGSVRRDR